MSFRRVFSCSPDVTKAVHKSQIMKEVQQRDFYQVLGVESNANQKEIERAYQRLVDRYHLTPFQQSFLEDVPQKDSMGLIYEAYKTLSNKGQREVYDRRISGLEETPPPHVETESKPVPAPAASPQREKTHPFPELQKGEKKKLGNVYQDYFGFSEKPFDLTPDPKYLYLSPKHKEVLAHLVYGMQENNGFLKIVGEVGTGKTMICRSFLRELHTDFNIAYILNPCVNSLELLQAINKELGLPSDSDSKKELIDDLNAFLLEQRKSGHRVVVIIDEAQDLEPSVLEQLRLISNLETETEKLIQIVLIGQPELDKHLAKDELRQLRQRITIQWQLLPLNKEETRGYVQHRINVALGKGKVHFTHRATELIYQYTQGIPRMINVLADRSLLIAYTMNTKKVGSKIVHLAAKDAGGLSRPPSWTRIFWKIVAPTAALTAALFYVFDWASLPYPNRLEKDIKKMIRELPAELPEPSKAVPAIPVETTPPPTVEPAKAAEPVPAPVELSPPEEQKKAIPGSVTFSQPERLAAYLSSLSHMESKAEAIKWVLKSWGIPTANLDISDEFLFSQIESDYGLISYEMSGDFKQLATLNYPAVLELTLPNSQGTKYLSLTGIQNDSGIFGSSDQMEMPLATIDSLWNHKAIIFWRDFEKLPQKFDKGFQGKEAVWLQKNLRLLGFFQGREAPLYGQKTVEAVLKFQRQYNIKDDGRFGAESKILLYNLLSIYTTPKLIAP